MEFKTVARPTRINNGGKWAELFHAIAKATETNEAISVVMSREQMQAAAASLYTYASHATPPQKIRMRRDRVAGTVTFWLEPKVSP